MSPPPPVVPTAAEESVQLLLLRAATAAAAAAAAARRFSESLEATSRKAESTFAAVCTQKAAEGEKKKEHLCLSTESIYRT